jgi:transposase-like protein
MPRRRGRRKLTPAKVKAIFTSREPVAKIAAQHGVSANLVYAIHARQIHKAITAGLRKVRRARRRGRMATRAAAVRIDLDRLADKIIKRLIARLRGRG